MKKTRFLKSVLATASKETPPPMPWARGTPRNAMIARRRNALPKLKSA